jgi:hypothetical protein
MGAMTEMLFDVMDSEFLSAFMLTALFCICKVFGTERRCFTDAVKLGESRTLLRCVINNKFCKGKASVMCAIFTTNAIARNILHAAIVSFFARESPDSGESISPSPQPAFLSGRSLAIIKHYTTSIQVWVTLHW